MSSLSKLQQFWENALDEVEITRLPEGETGLTAGQVLNARRLEAIAEWFAIPDRKRDPKDVLGLARALGVSPASIRKWQRDPRMVRRVQQKLIETGTYMMPNVLYEQYKRAVKTGDPNAAKFVRDTVGMGPQGGSRDVNVITNVNVSTDSDAQDDFVLDEVNRIVERRTRARLEARRFLESRSDEALSGDLGKPAVEAIPPDPGGGEVSPEPSPAPSPVGTEPRGENDGGSL